MSAKRTAAAEVCAATVGSRPPRVTIERVAPSVDAGRFAVKRIVGQTVVVSADVVVDGHDHLLAVVRWHPAGSRRWDVVPMVGDGNDRYRATITPSQLGVFEFEVRVAIDAFATWHAAFEVRRNAAQDLSSDRAVGEALLLEAASRARGEARKLLAVAAQAVGASDDAGIDLVSLSSLVNATIPADQWTGSGRYEITVERERAQTSSWYELFPRAAGFNGAPGTLADVARRLPYVAELGFDVLYLPPIHPIGTTNRKGPRGGPSRRGDPGSPWAIGSRAGGHTAINPDLGTIADFDRLVASAGAIGIEIALDYALQCSPDHPWVTEHPGWFRHRPDGTIACAENPPKRYEDVYPLDFECEQWRELWAACKAILDFWIDHGVRIFRVDNPHTKPFGFWEWVIREVRGEHPEVIFLAEAFTRPRVMEHLAKLGFSQSYTYFTWRRGAAEIAAYFGELTSPPISEYFRPNAWPNTPDILVWPLAGGNRAAFSLRAVLAATLSANWGIYGPAFEHGENVARDDAEEYAHSDKFEIRAYDFDPTSGVAPLIARLNAIRRDEPALQTNLTLRFHHSGNPELLVYSKRPESTDVAGGVLVVANLDPYYRQSGWVTIDPAALGFASGSTLELTDQLTGERYRWTPGENFVVLDPEQQPAHIFVFRWAA